MSPPRRVALVGYGLAGRVFHAPLIASTPGLHVAAVVTGRRGVKLRAADERLLARVYEATAPRRSALLPGAAAST